MLILEIAAGVLLGLFLYRGLDSFCKRRNLTMPAGVFAIGLAILVICILLAAITAIAWAFSDLPHLRRAIHENAKIVLWLLGTLFAVSFLIAIRSDLGARATAKKMAARTSCERCGHSGLRFRRFKNGLEEGHNHPTGTCPQCRNEQELSP